MQHSAHTRTVFTSLTLRLRWLAAVCTAVCVLGLNATATRAAAPESFHPSLILPPPDGAYVSPDDFHIAYAAGYVISNISHSFFTASNSLPPPPLGGSQIHSFPSEVDFNLWRAPAGPTVHIRAPATVRVKVTHTSDAPPFQFFDTEMLQLDIAGGDLPPGCRCAKVPRSHPLARAVRGRPRAGS